MPANPPLTIYGKGSGWGDNFCQRVRGWRWWDAASCCLQVFLFLFPRPAPPGRASRVHLFRDSRHPDHHRPSCIPLPHNPWQRNRPEGRVSTASLPPTLMRCLEEPGPPGDWFSRHVPLSGIIGRRRPPGELFSCKGFRSIPAPRMSRTPPKDHQRHPGDEFCHPLPGPWTLIAGTRHPGGAGALPPPHRIK